MGFLILNGAFAMLCWIAMPFAIVGSAIWKQIRRAAFRMGYWDALDTNKFWEWSKTGD